MTVRSMTGYGRAERVEGTLAVRVEIRTVNHRFLDLNVKLPRSWSPLEPRVASILRDRLGRGRVDVTVRREQDRGASVRARVDLGLAGQVVAAARALHDEHGVAFDLGASALLAQPGVLCFEEAAVDAEAEAALLDAALGDALGQVLAMREAEGKRLRADLLARLEALQTNTERAASLAADVRERITERITERLSDLLADGTLEPSRLAQEAALLADRAAVDEEVTRLHAHIEQARGFLAMDEPVGRRLDFLVQELNREANTLASKSSEPALSALAVDIKSVVEKLKEQVANVE